MVGKSLAAFAIVLAFGYPVTTALTVSASLAQIGEFSFILAGLGVALGLLPPEGRDLILAGALLSITLNPLRLRRRRSARRLAPGAAATDRAAGAHRSDQLRLPALTGAACATTRSSSATGGSAG